MSTRGDQTDGTSTCTRQVKKYSQNNKEWPLCVYVVGELSCCCCCKKANNDLGLLPSSKNVEALESGSTPKTQKKPKKLSWNS